MVCVRDCHSTLPTLASVFIVVIVSCSVSYCVYDGVRGGCVLFNKNNRKNKKP